jgi:hypothetical protein
MEDSASKGRSDDIQEVCFAQLGMLMALKGEQGEAKQVSSTQRGDLHDKCTSANAGQDCCLLKYVC